MTLTGRKGTIVVVALIVSVCINLAAAGLAIGHRWHDGPGRGGMWGMMRGVPEEAQPLVKEIFDANRAEFDTKRAAVDEARQRVAAILQADTIDRPALDAALADMQLRLGEMFQMGQKVIGDVAQKLPPEVRKEWAKKWVEERRWKKKD
jgi:Spy/CpxP family protein refolding chaperone